MREYIYRILTVAGGQGGGRRPRARYGVHLHSHLLLVSSKVAFIAESDEGTMQQVRVRGSHTMTSITHCKQASKTVGLDPDLKATLGFTTRQIGARGSPSFCTSDNIAAAGAADRGVLCTLVSFELPFWGARGALWVPLGCL